VDEAEAVHDCAVRSDEGGVGGVTGDCLDNLAGELSYVVESESPEVVALEEVEEGHAEAVEDEAAVAVVHEPSPQPHAVTGSGHRGRARRGGCTRSGQGRTRSGS
jgi:hypothetical protein